MSTFLKKIAIYSVCILIIANVLSYASLWALRQGNFYKPSFLVNEVSENDFDYIVLGASTGLTTINTEVIDSLSNKSGINLSIDDTSISSQYLMLRHFLESGKTTKVCILAPGVTSFDEQTLDISNNDYRFLPFFERSYVSDYFQSFKGTRANVLSKSKYMPMLGVSYYNAEIFYPSIVSLIQPNRYNRFDAKGNYTYPVQNTPSKIIGSRETLNLKFLNPALKQIKDICDKENIKLICYISPIKKVFVVGEHQDYEIINHSNKLIQTKYFYDDVHVNSLGRQIISEQLAYEMNSYFDDKK